MRIIETEADIAEGLAHLAARDRRLRKVIAVAGTVPLRRAPHGLEGLARIVVAQQVSVASAEAIWLRFAGAFPKLTPGTLLEATEETFRAAGLSGPKIRTLRAVAEAIAAGLDLDGLAELPGEEAHAALTAIKGIGPWTADIYLLFCLGHADIFPAGDLALRIAVADALGKESPMSIANLEEMARKWSPWRGVAARLFWSYYRARKQRAALPV
ncbi:MAG: DNA-3-methyladenine glycosylase [Bauldia sp.]